jgi:hypothetical protein
MLYYSFPFGLFLLCDKTLTYKLAVVKTYDVPEDGKISSESEVVVSHTLLFTLKMLWKECLYHNGYGTLHFQLPL